METVQSISMGLEMNVRIAAGEDGGKGPHVLLPAMGEDDAPTRVGLTRYTKRHMSPMGSKLVRAKARRAGACRIPHVPRPLQWPVGVAPLRILPGSNFA